MIKRIVYVDCVSGHYVQICSSQACSLCCEMTNYMKQSHTNARTEEYEIVVIVIVIIIIITVIIAIKPAIIIMWDNSDSAVPRFTLDDDDDDLD